MPQRIPSYVAIKLRTRESRPHAAARGYCSKRHRSWRASVLLNDSYACRQCGSISKSNHADHIVPVTRQPELRYELSNGQTLCNACHILKTMQESRSSR